MSDFLISISNRNIPLLWGTVFTLLMTFFWRFPKYRHKRYRNNIILLAFLFGVTTTLYILNFLSVAIIFSLSILYAGYLILAAEKVLFPESSPIFILETLVKKGNYKEIEKRFPQKPFYIISVPGKIKWNLLWANKFIAQDRSKEDSAMFFL